MEFFPSLSLYSQFLIYSSEMTFFFTGLIIKYIEIDEKNSQRKETDYRFSFSEENFKCRRLTIVYDVFVKSTH